MKHTLALFALLICFNDSHAQTGNIRGWAYIKQNMVGNQPSITSTPVSTFNSVSPFKYYSLAVNSVGSPSWDVRLEGSNDAVAWTTILLNSSTTHSAGAPIFQSSAMPALYLRVRAASLTLAGQITATAIGVP